MRVIQKTHGKHLHTLNHGEEVVRQRGGGGGGLTRPLFISGRSKGEEQASTRYHHLASLVEVRWSEMHMQFLTILATTREHPSTPPKIQIKKHIEHHGNNPTS